MEAEGKYVYCIIEALEDRSFGPIGIGGRGNEVITIGYKDIAVVVSNSPTTKYTVSSDNVLAHQRVIEEVMKEYTVLPVRFCTIAGSVDEIKNLLHRRYREFQGLLKEMRHKVELGVKAVWNDMGRIFKEITEENKDIKETVEKNKGEQNIQARMEIGRQVSETLKRKKEMESEAIVSLLKRSAIDYRLNKTFDDRMFLNAAFLVDRGRQMEFDNIMDNLSDNYREKVKFKYVGPIPPFNFVTITIYPEEWER